MLVYFRCNDFFDILFNLHNDSIPLLGSDGHCCLILTFYGGDSMEYAGQFLLEILYGNIFFDALCQAGLSIMVLGLGGEPENDGTFYVLMMDQNYVYFGAGLSFSPISENASFLFIFSGSDFG